MLDFLKWLSSYITKIYNIWIFVSGLVVWFILLVIPDGFILDHLNLRKSIENGTFTRILLSFISIFGFLITILILTYGFLREKFRRLALKEFLENKCSNFLLSFFVITFLLNIFSTVYLDSHQVTHTSLNLAYYSLYSSVLYIVFFLPIAFISIAEADSQWVIGKYLNVLKPEDFPEYPYHELTVTHDEKNPIVVIINLCRSFLDKDDFHSINSVIFSFQKRIEELIGNSKDRIQIGGFLTGQRMVWELIINKAIQKKEYHIINNLLMAYSVYHSSFSKKQIPLLYLEELSFFMKSLVERLVKEDATEAVEQVLLTYEQILEYHYDNSVPPEGEIRDLKYMLRKDDGEKKGPFKMRPPEEIDRIDLQWQMIHSDIPYIFSIILTKAIEKKNTVLFERAIMSIPSLIHKAHRSKMGDLQKTFILTDLVGTLHYHQIEALKKDVLKDTFRIKSILDSFVITTIIDESKDYKSRLLQSASGFLIDLFKQNKLDRHQINFLASVGRHCSNKFLESKSQKETFRYILKVVRYFKSAFEQDLEANAKNYMALREAVESFIDFHKMASLTTWKPGQQEQKKETDSSLMNELSMFLSEFKSTSLQEMPGSIPWDDKKGAT